MSLKETLTENIGVKLIAFVVAVFIWFNASGQQEIDRLRAIPLVIENVSDSLTMTGIVPSQIEIRVTGTKRQLLMLGFKRVDSVIDMAGAGPGRQRISLSSANVRIPPGIDRRNIAVIEPTIVDLHLERLVSKRVQVALSTTGAIQPDLVLIDGGLQVEPSWVTVRGPESTIERIKNIPTETVDLSRLRTSGDRELLLDYDPGLITCEPAGVVFVARLSEKGERVLANVPPTILVDSHDVDVVVLPTTVSLTLVGPSALLDTLSSGDVSVLLNLSGREPGQYKFAPEVILPPGVSLAGISVDTLVVRLTKGDAADSSSSP